MAGQNVSQSDSGAKERNDRPSCLLYSKMTIAIMTTTSGLLISKIWMYIAATIDTVMPMGAITQHFCDVLIA